MAVQAISTLFYGPTNHKGLRIKAICQYKSKFYSFSPHYSHEVNHLLAAQALATDMKWIGRWWSGWGHIRHSDIMYHACEIGDFSFTVVV